MNGQYKRVKINGATYYAHRLVWEMQHGPIPIGHIVHHKDGDKHNNAIDNLELVSRAEHRRHHDAEEKASPAYSEKKSRAAKAKRLHAYKCAQCSIDFMAVAVAGAKRRFCSTRCKNARTSAERKAA